MNKKKKKNDHATYKKKTDKNTFYNTKHHIG